MEPGLNKIMAKLVLVVDDDRITVGIIRNKLTEHGYEAHTAANGREAFERLKAKVPDMIILDVNMPDMNGYTFIMEKNKIPEFAHVPVVMLTASKETEPLFKRHRIKGYLLKPIQMQDLLNKINEVIGPSA